MQRVEKLRAVNREIQEFVNNCNYYMKEINLPDEGWHIRRLRDILLTNHQALKKYYPSKSKSSRGSYCFDFCGLFSSAEDLDKSVSTIGDKDSQVSSEQEMFVLIKLNSCAQRLKRAVALAVDRAINNQTELDEENVKNFKETILDFIDKLKILSDDFYCEDRHASNKKNSFADYYAYGWERLTEQDKSRMLNGEVPFYQFNIVFSPTKERDLSYSQSGLVY